MAREIVGPIREALRNFGFALTSAMTFDPALSNRQFRIGMRLSGEVPNFASLVARVRARAPNAMITSAHFAREELGELLANGDLDLAFDILHPHKKGLNQQLLREDRLVVVARRGHPDVDGKISLETYLRLDHVFASPRSSGLGYEDGELAREGLHRRIAVRCQNAMSAWNIVSQSDMLFTLPKRYAEGLLKLQDNQLVDLPLSIRPTTLYMYWHEASEADPGLIWLRDIIVSEPLVS